MSQFGLWKKSRNYLSYLWHSQGKTLNPKENGGIFYPLAVKRAVRRRNDHAYHSLHSPPTPARFQTNHRDRPRCIISLWSISPRCGDPTTEALFSLHVRRKIFTCALRIKQANQSQLGNTTTVFSLKKNVFFLPFVSSYAQAFVLEGEPSSSSTLPPPFRSAHRCCILAVEEKEKMSLPA